MGRFFENELRISIIMSLLSAVMPGMVALPPVPMFMPGMAGAGAVVGAGSGMLMPGISIPGMAGAAALARGAVVAGFGLDAGAFDFGLGAGAGIDISMPGIWVCWANTEVPSNRPREVRKSVFIK
ncbi:hypothetical protein GCM10028822_07150 [Hymenobacter terrigena]